MHSESLPTVPLLGALIIAEGLLTQEQLEACLLLQQQERPHRQIGEILLSLGHITAKDLERILQRQHQLRLSLVEAISPQNTPAPDLRALVLSAHPRPALDAALRQAGITHSYATTLPNRHQAFDLLLVDPVLLNRLQGTISPEVEVGLLPPGIGEGLLPATGALIARYAEQARVGRKARVALEQLRHADFELHLLAALMREVMIAGSTRAGLMKLMMIIRDLILVEAGTLFRLDQSDQRLVFELVLGPYSETLSQQRLPLDRGIAGWVASHGEPLLIPDVRQDPRFNQSFDQQTGFQTRAVVCVPLMALGQTCGVIQLINKLDGEFNERDLLMLRITAAVGGLLLMLDAAIPTASPSWLGKLI